jgi:hypothetical protein
MYQSRLLKYSNYSFLIPSLVSKREYLYLADDSSTASSEEHKAKPTGKVRVPKRRTGRITRVCEKKAIMYDIDIVLSHRYCQHQLIFHSEKVVATIQHALVAVYAKLVQPCCSKA